MSYGWYRSWSWSSSSGPGPEEGDEDSAEDGGKEEASRPTPSHFPAPKQEPDESVVGGAASAQVSAFLTPERLQDYLLDLVRLEGVYAFTGTMEDTQHTPVANWLRSLGYRMVYSDQETTYYLQRCDTNTLEGELPDYLMRFLALLEDDSFTEPQGVPAYQALSLLTYVITTERYRAITEGR